MNFFLQKVAKYLIEKHSEDLANITILVPSKRSSLFLFKYLSEELNMPFIAPKTLTWKDFIEKHTQCTQIDQLSLSFILYEAYTKTSEKAESFEEFSRWSSIILSDFNEIDNYNLDAKKIYQNLKNIQDLEEIDYWSFQEEELSEMQKTYNSFYQSLFPLYEEFNRLLDQKKAGYPGKLKRNTARIEKLPEKQGFTYWIGFYAIAPIEQAIIDQFLAESKGYVFWDANDYYVDNKRNLAGDFFRKAIDNNKKKYNWIEEYKDKKQNITAHGVAGRVLQCSAANKILNELALDNAALILADEDLLIPTLENISTPQESFNISIQISLEKSPFILLILSLINLHEKAKTEQGRTLFYHEKVFHFLNNPILNYSTGQSRQLRSDRTFYDQKAIRTVLEENEIEGLINVFVPCKNQVPEILDRIENLLDFCRYKVNKDQRDAFYLEMLVQSSLFLKKLINYCRTFNFVSSFTVLKRLINRLSKEQKLDFFGEPLKGLQVIGLLESRALDFKNIIVLGCNEGVLPNTSLKPSFIPHDLRKDFGLPTQKEYESIYAYYFYRLLHHAENIHLIYSNKVGAIGSSEKSRFISQLEFEHQFGRFKSPIKHLKHNTSNKSPLASNAKIEKNELSRKLIEAHFLPRISASTLNKYLECPSAFYFESLQKLGLPENLQEQLQSNAIGTIVHGVLENLYKPFVNGPALSPEKLKDLDKQIEPIFEQVIRQENLTKTMQSSLNQLIKAAIFEGVRKQLKRDIAQAGKGKLEIIGLEESLKANVQLGKYKVGLKGKIDRIDRLDGVVRIIDYKTGSVQSSDLTITELSNEKLRQKPKLIQLLFYYLLYYEVKRGKHCLPGMFSTLNSKTEPEIVLINKLPIDQESMHFFKEFLENIIDEMMYGDAFEHDSDAKYCNFCFVSKE